MRYLRHRVVHRVVKSFAIKEDFHYGWRIILNSGYAGESMTRCRSGGKRVVVLGVGNLLLRDEGVGIHAVRELASLEWPPGVAVVDGGTAGLDLLPYFEEADMVVVIDCLDADTAPGTIYRIPVAELDLDDKTRDAVSLHEMRLKDVLVLARRMGKLPPTVVYGVQPAAIAWGLELSPEVANVLPQLTELVKRDVSVWLAEERLF